MVIHNRMGFRCGYVRLPLGHPWHGKGYDDLDVRVHGGLTFAEADMPCGKGESDDAWWIGFDCGHGGDSADPSLPTESHLASRLLSFPGSVIRTQEYIEAECRSLCEQATRAVSP
jgi:hypothetical protein